MIAAIYARKSTEQNGVADEARSVTRQIEHARAYAASKGWTVADDHVYVDDGISGAEFEARRPALLRMLTSLKPRPPFDVLIVSEESRIGREQIAVSSILKELISAGVRVFCYMNDSERTLNSPIEKVLLSLQSFADEMERERARLRTFDAMQRRARAGYVTGGLTFGYTNVDVTGPDGSRSHVERRINDAEAAIVRRIFDLCADGCGLKLIACTLNDEHAITPRAQQGRPHAWAPSSVRAILQREVYRGVIVWGQTKKRDQWGQRHSQARPASEWMRIDAPHLRIISDDQWHAAQARMRAAREQFARSGDGTLLFGRPPATLAAKYFLSGLLRCGVCHAGMIVKSRAHGRTRSHRYACSSYHLKGRAVCGMKLEGLMPQTDALVIEALKADVLHPDVVKVAIAHALQVIQERTANDGARLTTATAAIDRIDREIARLTTAIVGGGDLDALVAALRDRQEARAALQADVDRIRQTTQAPIDPADVERRLRERLKDWRGLLAGNVAWTRQLLAKLLRGKIVLTPVIEKGSGAPAFKVQIPFTLRPLFEGILASPCPTRGTSPTGFEPVFWP